MPQVRFQLQPLLDRLPALVLVGFYTVVLCPDFFSTQHPEATDARLAFIPIQRVRIFDGPAVRPWVPVSAPGEAPASG